MKNCKRATTIRRRLWWPVPLVVLLLLVGCAVQPNAAITPTVTDPVNDVEDMFTDRDEQTEYDDAYVLLSLADDNIRCDSAAVSIEGHTVTIGAAGTYVLEGALSDGQIAVVADKADKIHLVLRNVQINSRTSAALVVRQADKVFVTLEANTLNALTNSGDFATDSDNIDAAVFSKEDITFNGEGSLTVNTDYGHGIVSKDDLVFTGGNYTITAAKHALCGKDCVKIADGTYKLTAGTDGIHAENADDTTLGYLYIADGRFTIDAQSDGIDSGNYLQIAGGDFTVTCGGKAIKATDVLTIADGTFDLRSTDDCVHSNADVAIQGGQFDCATQDDGFHADQTLQIDGGVITVSSGYEGLEGLSVIITGGTVSVTVSDDGINAGGGNDSSGFGGFWGGRPGGDRFGQTSSSASLLITGGTVRVNAGGDGLDSNGSLTIGGGLIYVSADPSGDDSAIDYDGQGTITGGIVVAVGSRQMAQNFGTASTQGSMLLTYSSLSQNEVTLYDADGETLVSYTPPKGYYSAVISCPQLVVGGTYTVSAGGQSTTVTMTTLLYGSGGGTMPGGGKPGGRP